MNVGPGRHFMFGQNGDGNHGVRNHELFNGGGVHTSAGSVSGNLSGSHVNVNKKYSSSSSGSGTTANLTINNNADYPQGQNNNTMITTTTHYKRNNASNNHNVSVLSSTSQQAGMTASYTSLSPSSSSAHLSPQNQSYSSTMTSATPSKPPVTTTPPLHSEFMSAANTAIRIKAACNGNVYISSLDSNFTLDEFTEHIQTICNMEPAASPMPISHSNQSSNVSNSLANESAFSLSSVG